MRLLHISEVQAIQLELMKKLHVFLEENNIKYYLIAGSALGAVRHNGFIPWDDDIDIGIARDDYEKFISIADKFDDKYDIINFKNAKNCDFGLTRIYIRNTFIDNTTIANTKLDKRLYFDVFPLDNVPNDSHELASYEKKIQNKKKQIELIDTRNYKSSRIKIIAKKYISVFLQPFRSCILRSFDRLMKKYRYYNTDRICSLCSQYSFKKQVMQKSVYGIPTLHKFEDSEFYIPEKINDYLTILYGSNYMEIPPPEKRRVGYNIYTLNED